MAGKVTDCLIERVRYQASVRNLNATSVPGRPLPTLRHTGRRAPYGIPGDWSRTLGAAAVIVAGRADNTHFVPRRRAEGEDRP